MLVYFAADTDTVFMTTRLADTEEGMSLGVREKELPEVDRLRLVLQAAIGWTNSHLYEITAQGVGLGIPDADFGDGPLDAKTARLIDVLEDCGVKTLECLYDFGDGWEHTVKIERIENAIPGLTSPFLVDAVGRCPPEDVGGPSGYEEVPRGYERHGARKL